MITQHPLSIAVRAISLASATALIATTAQANNIEEVIVSATLNEKSQHLTLAAADVFSRDELQDLQLADVSEALRLVAGADLVSSGGLGAPVSLFTRGSNSTHTLMLINGQRFSSATSGNSAFELIDPALVERVEYVRGARSSLYGSEAIGGVLQMFTYGYNADPSHYVNFEAGSHATYRTAVGSRGKVGKTRYAAGISTTTSDGIDHHENTEGNNADLDAFEKLSGSLFTSYTFDSDVELGFSFISTDAENDYDNASRPAKQPYKKQQVQALQGNIAAPLSSSFTTRLNIGQSKDNSDSYDRIDPAEYSPFKTIRQNMFWQNDWQLKQPLLLTFGIDAHNEEVATKNTYAETERSNVAPFAQLQGQYSKADFVVGLRNDDNSSFGSKSTGSAAAGYSFDKRFRVFASWAQGFQAPTFNDLYYPESWGYVGNPDVLPEESDNIELGFKAQQSFASWEIIAYKNDVKNLIDWLPTGDGFTRPTNVDEAELKGVEASLRGQIYSVVFAATASYVSPKDKQTGEDLHKRSRQKYTFQLGQDFEKVNYGLLFVAQGKRKNIYQDDLESYNLVDLYLNYQPIKPLNIGVKIANAADTQYIENAGYNTDGRNYKASIRYTF